jgi:lipopolysaccharide export LptBFGC system permease protein LptF
MKLWQRYLLRRLAKSFLLFILCILSLYIVVDISINGVKFFSKETTTLGSVLLNYLSHFAQYLDLFFSLSFLLASLRILVDTSMHGELTALHMAGLSEARLLTPFILFALCLAAGSYVNSQWLSPGAHDAADAFQVKHSKGKERKEKVFTASLEDGTELVYRKFDPEKGELFDVFWIRSPEDIWHIKSLKVDPSPPSGRYADHLQRSQDGPFEKTESFLVRSFPDIPWQGEAPLQRFVPFENRPLGLLIRQALLASSEKTFVQSHLHYKLAKPLIPLLLVLSLGPYAMRFRRGRNLFFFFACSVFGLVGLLTLLDSCLILAENQVLAAWMAIWAPLLSILLISLPCNFSKNKV